MINVYFADAAALSSETLYAAGLNTVSEFRREKTERYKFRKDRNLSLGAGLLLDAALKKHGLREKEMQYAENGSGKPFFKNAPELFFNISHSGEKLMLCFSTSEIGCDIEKIKSANTDVARRFFHANEYTALMEMKDENARDEFFCRLWTLKESYIKMIGGGLSIPMDSFEITFDCGKAAVKQNLSGACFLKEFDAFPGYKSALCSGNGISTCVEYIEF